MKMKNAKLHIGFMNSKLNFLSYLILTCLVASCNPIDKKGYRFEFSDAHLLKRGITSKENVEKIMGSPTLISYLDKEDWIYYLQDEKKFMFFTPEVLERKIITISFDEYQIIDKINHYDLKDERQVAFLDQKTGYITVNKSKNVFSKIFSNIGQITPN